MKYVITGGPCTGKTTLIDSLRGLGFGIIEEAARQVLANSHGKTFHELQRDIYDLQVARERRIDGNDFLYFLDRGWVDNHAYFKHYVGAIPGEFLTAPVRKYDRVFVLDRLPLVNDTVRHEDEQTASSLHRRIIEAYTEAGYSPILVPASGIEKRLEQILSYLPQLAGQQ